MTNKLQWDNKDRAAAIIKKAIFVLIALATLTWGQFVWAEETYTYSGPNFTGFFGNYDATMSVTGSITTSTPIPPNLTDYNIGALVTNWSFTDGVNTLQAPGSVLIALVNTNDTGDIVGGQIGAFTLPWRTQVGDIQDWIVIRYDPALNQGIEDLECTEDDGNGTCTNNTSAGHGEVLAVGTWARTGDAALYTVGGSVSGLAGTGLSLQNNGVDTLAIDANGSFTFVTELVDTATYVVTVSTQPTGQTCSVTNGSGTIAAADVTNVAVTCVDDVVVPPMPATPIPTTSQWALILLSMLIILMVFANRRLLF